MSLRKITSISMDIIKSNRYILLIKNSIHRSSWTLSNDDFFGIIDYERNLDKQSPDVSLNGKVEDIEIIEEAMNQQSAIENSTHEHYIQTNYGLIRRDSDNVVISRRQRRKLTPLQSSGKRQDSTMSKNESTNPFITSTSIPETENYFDELLLDSYKEGQDTNASQQHRMKERKSTITNEAFNVESDMNFIDRQFFSANLVTNTAVKNVSKLTTGPEKALDRHTDHCGMVAPHVENLSYVDNQYFSPEGITSDTKPITDNCSSDDVILNESDFGQSDTHDYKDPEQSNTNSQTADARTTTVENPNVGSISENDCVSQSSKTQHRWMGTSTDLGVQNTLGISEAPAKKSAYDYVMKVRAQNQRLEPCSQDVKVNFPPAKGEYSDSKGYRILRNHITDFTKLTRSEVVDMLVNSIIYDENEILAIDKPYGLPSHGGPGCTVSVGQLLHDLGERLGLCGQNYLHLVHRLDKETTGVMILARSTKMAALLKSQFVAQTVIKKYWVVTKGIPNPVEGIIDLPLRESKVGKTYRIMAQPLYDGDTKLVMRNRSHSASPAITNYKVLDSNHSSALVECQPQTGKKHQVRVHLASGLNTPVLGDHKYSHFSKLAPQTLNPEMLQRLGVRQSKVRHIPMHLHSQTIVFPQLVNGRNVKVSVKPPRYFLKTLQRLQLKHPIIH